MELYSLEMCVCVCVSVFMGMYVQLFRIDSQQ